MQRNTQILEDLKKAHVSNEQLLAVLIDPDKFDVLDVISFLASIPQKNTTHLFVGGSTVDDGQTFKVIEVLKVHTKLPVIIFPGAANQISKNADALLFLSLLSGNNPEYLIGQQKKGAAQLIDSRLEVIPTGYLLIDGGNESAVARVTKTTALSASDIDAIVHTALAGELMGAQLIYLEAGSGAITPVSSEIIMAVRNAIQIPLIVGGGIRTKAQKTAAYNAGATLVVMGTAFEN